MREIIHPILSAIPAKILGGLGWLAMLFATLWPDRARKLADKLVTPDQIQFWGLYGLAFFSLYWVLWLWSKPRANSEQPATSNAAITIEAGEDIRFEEVVMTGHEHQIAKIGTPTSSPKGVHFGKVTSNRGERRGSPENDRALIHQIETSLGGNRTVQLAWVETDGSATLAMQLNSLLSENRFAVEIVGAIPMPDPPLVKRLSLRGSVLIVDATK